MSESVHRKTAARLIEVLQGQVAELVERAQAAEARAIRAEGVVTSLRDAAKDCADDLEAEVRNRYHYPDIHPAMQWRYDRDMEPVLAVRAAIEAP